MFGGNCSDNFFIFIIIIIIIFLFLQKDGHLNYWHSCFQYFFAPSLQTEETIKLSSVVFYDKGF